MANERRLIDANALIDFIDVGQLRNQGELCYSEVDVANLLLHAPTVDAVEVVHGRWILVDTEKEIGVCSNCNRQDGIDNLATHCRFCGAKMDLEEWLCG